MIYALLIEPIIDHINSIHRFTQYGASALTSTSLTTPNHQQREEKENLHTTYKALLYVYNSLSPDARPVKVKGQVGVGLGWKQKPITYIRVIHKTKRGTQGLYYSHSLFLKVREVGVGFCA